MSEYKVEKGIPIPEPHKKTTTFPFSELEVGDSFFVPNKTGAYLYAHITNYRQKNKKKKFRVKSDAAGVRCWRIQ